MKSLSLIVVGAVTVAATLATPAFAYESAHEHMMRHHHIIRNHTMMNQRHMSHGIGGGRRTTATGGNAGGYSDRN